MFACMLLRKWLISGSFGAVKTGGWCRLVWNPESPGCGVQVAERQTRARPEHQSSITKPQSKQASVAEMHMCRVVWACCSRIDMKPALACAVQELFFTFSTAQEPVLRVPVVYLT